MRLSTCAAAIAIALMGSMVAHAGEHGVQDAYGSRFLQRVHPEGGWNPGGGLFHWWNPHCFPQTCAPNDYCRKPAPNVCWPPYPPYYRWAEGRQWPVNH